MSESTKNLGSGSWSAWANDTAAHYAAIRCPHQQTVGSTVQSADIPHYINNDIRLPGGGNLVLHFNGAEASVNLV